MGGRILVVAVVLVLAAVEGQDVTADCSWEPEEQEQQLICHLKTLQAGPAVLPQV
jgi:hypothetical protein